MVEKLVIKDIQQVESILAEMSAIGRKLSLSESA